MWFSSKACFSLSNLEKLTAVFSIKKKLPFPERVLLLSVLHEHIREVEIYCQDAALNEREAQNRWWTPWLHPSIFLRGQRVGGGQMRLFSSIQAQAQESSEWGQYTETVTLASKSWTWYSQIQYYCIKIQIRSYTSSKIINFKGVTW